MNMSITKESNENILNTSSVMRQLDCGEVTIRFAEKFIFLWDEQGTGSGTKHISLCQPLPDNCDNEEGFFSLGSVAVHAWKISDCVSHGVSGILIKQNYIPDGKMPALAHPVDFEERWNSVNSGAIICGSIWRPVPPEGYVALGDVANNRYGSRSKPDVKQVVCVRSDLAVEGTLEGDTFIWNDATSGGTHDVSLWEIKPKSAFSVENCSIFVAS